MVPSPIARARYSSSRRNLSSATFARAAGALGADRHKKSRHGAEHFPAREVDSQVVMSTSHANARSSLYPMSHVAHVVSGSSNREQTVLFLASRRKSHGLNLGSHVVSTPPRVSSPSAFSWHVGHATHAPAER